MAGAERELRQKERGRNSNSDIELNKYKLRQETKNKNFEWHGQWHLTIFGEPLLRFRLSLDVMENDERQKGKAKRYGSYFPKTYKIAEGEKSIYMKKVLKKNHKTKKEIHVLRYRRWKKRAWTLESPRSHSDTEGLIILHSSGDLPQLSFFICNVKRFYYTVSRYLDYSDSSSQRSHSP